jgi:Ca2+-binding EF-hand superfamily protein
VSFDQRFDEVDINHDGGLSKDEAEIGMPMLFKHFDEIDSNKDGKISKEEIVANMKKKHHKKDKINENGGDAMKKGGQQ